MKQKKIEKKLNLSKKTVANLELQNMDSLKGGILTYLSCYETCKPCNTERTCDGCPDLRSAPPTCQTGYCLCNTDTCICP